jgi:hypothetical protein
VGVLTVVGGLLLGWWDVCDGFEEAPVVLPVDPFEGGEPDGFEVSPWPLPVDDLGLEQADDRLGEGIVIRVAEVPRDGSIPASARRSVYRIDRSRTPRSE